MRLVLDTSTIVAAMRSPAGVSAHLLRRARLKQISLLANIALALEYEAVCLRPEHLTAAQLTAAEANIFVTAVIALCEPVESYFLWRPQLRDPADEFVLEAAVNGRAEAIITFNRRDFLPAAQRFGIEIVGPDEILRRLS